MPRRVPTGFLDPGRPLTSPRPPLWCLMCGIDVAAFVAAGPLWSRTSIARPQTGPASNKLVLDSWLSPFLPAHQQRLASRAFNGLPGPAVNSPVQAPSLESGGVGAAPLATARPALWLLLHKVAHEAGDPRRQGTLCIFHTTYMPCPSSRWALGSQCPPPPPSRLVPDGGALHGYAATT